MAGIIVNGIRQLVPGAYGITNIISDEGAAIPDFQVGAILASGDIGIPYNFNTALKKTGETARPVFKEFGSSSLVEAEFGKNSDMAIAYREAKNHGLIRCYTTAIDSLTRCSSKLKDGASVDAIDLFSKQAGAPLNWIQFQIVDAGSGKRQIKITPVTQFILLVSNASAGQTRLKVKNNA